MRKAAQEKLYSFFDKFQPLSFKKGDLIIGPNEKISSIFLLKKGLVKQYYISKEGEELTLHIFKPMSYFPMMLALSGKSNKYYFEASSKVSVIKCPTGEIMTFVLENTDVLFDLTGRFAKGILGLSERIEDLTSGNIHYKICSLLIYLARRMGKKSKSGIMIGLRMGHRDIASWVGTTRETASRQLEQLAKRKLIRYGSGKFTILDFDALLKEVENSGKRGEGSHFSSSLNGS
ncbi:Crp/Fnr family transcriptional regulator [Candidatus Woesebacteria bacterium]|nr:Crp/Fnr family transcriptional regulator [Candidatus Woesebacteria bacterium]